MNKIVKQFKRTSYTLAELKQAGGFGEDAVIRFVNLGLLTTTDTALHARQLSFPGLGVFTRTLHDGRKSLVAVVRKGKYSQALESELLKRQIAKCNIGKRCLGIELHLYDLYASGVVVIERMAHDVLIRYPTTS